MRIHEGLHLNFVQYGQGTLRLVLENPRILAFNCTMRAGHSHIGAGRSTSGRFWAGCFQFGAVCATWDVIRVRHSQVGALRGVAHTLDLVGQVLPVESTGGSLWEAQGGRCGEQRGSLREAQGGRGGKHKGVAVESTWGFAVGSTRGSLWEAQGGRCGKHILRGRILDSTPRDAALGEGFH